MKRNFTKQSVQRKGKGEKKKRKKKKSLLRDMTATDMSCSLRSGSRRKGLQKDHMNKYAFSPQKREIMREDKTHVEIFNGNACDDTCNINCRLQRMFRFTNQTSKSRAVVLSFNFVNGSAFGLLVHDHNCQIPDNVSEHRLQNARHQ